MIRHTQLILADPDRGDGHDRNGEAGDCLRAVVASILDVVDITTVPNFANAGNNYRWWVALREWARSLGFDFTSVVPEFPVPFDPETIDLDIPSYEMRGPRMWVDWRVGKSRRYFSRARAERTANLWRAMGYIVRVDESDPIVWPAS